MKLPAHWDYLNDMKKAELSREDNTIRIEYLELKEEEKQVRSDGGDFRKLRIVKRKLIANCEERKQIQLVLSERQ